jgi:hypothetical protein
MEQSSKDFHHAFEQFTKIYDEIHAELNRIARSIYDKASRRRYVTFRTVEDLERKVLHNSLIKLVERLYDPFRGSQLSRVEGSRKTLHYCASFASTSSKNDKNPQIPWSMHIQGGAKNALDIQMDIKYPDDIQTTSTRIMASKVFFQAMCFFRGIKPKLAPLMWFKLKAQYGENVNADDVLDTLQELGISPVYNGKGMAVIDYIVSEIILAHAYRLVSKKLHDEEWYENVPYKLYASNVTNEMLRSYKVLF